jgi:hypothetical protein
MEHFPPWGNKYDSEVAGKRQVRVNLDNMALTRAAVE